MNDRLFSALADGNRRAMIESLHTHGSGTATRFAADLAISRQAAAKHLRLLAEAGIVIDERVGRETRYRPSPGVLNEVVGWIDSVEDAWQRRLSALTAAVDDAQSTSSI